MSPDATIKEAQVLRVGDHRIVWGMIFGDRLQRWQDGTHIRTSYIVEGPDADGIVKTRNSVYQLVMPE